MNDVSKSHITWDPATVVTLVICIAIPILVGVFASFLTQNAMVRFNSMNKPPLAPPAWLFPVAWTILYILMGVSSFFILYSENEAHYVGLVLYVAQLLFNFVWSLIFFRFEAYSFAALWLIVLLSLIIALIVGVARYSKPAMIMLIPYAAWCCFALYLNIGIAIRN